MDDIELAIETTAKKAIKDYGYFCLAVKRDALYSILSSKKFLVHTNKNHNTKKLNKVRAEIENFIKCDNPVSGFITDNLDNLPSKNPDLLEEYGKYIIVFKKDKVIDHSFVVFEDSCTAWKDNIKPSKANNPKIQSFYPKQIEYFEKNMIDPSKFLGSLWKKSASYNEVLYISPKVEDIEKIYYFNFFGKRKEFKL